MEYVPKPTFLAFGIEFLKTAGTNHVRGHEECYMTSQFLDRGISQEAQYAASWSASGRSMAKHGGIFGPKYCSDPENYLRCSR